MLNLVECVILYAFLASNEMSELKEYGFLFVIVDKLFWVLCAYAVCYLAIPLFRYAIISIWNRNIEERNSKRKEKAVELMKVFLFLL